MERKIDLVSLKGVSIEYSIMGKGEPILVMHGGHSNCQEEMGYQELIDNGFSLITPSRPGYGKTSKEAGESLSLACEYYFQLLRHLNIEKVNLLAISAGGPSGIYFAAHYPTLVSSLALQSAVTKNWLLPEDKKYRGAKILFHPKAEKFTWAFISTIINRFPRLVFQQLFSSFSSLTYREAKEKIAENDVEGVRKMTNRQRSGSGFLMDLAQNKDLTVEDLRAVTCPTLILHSKYDGSVPLEHPYHAYEHISSSELYLLDSWGHLIWLGKSADEAGEKTVNFFKMYSQKTCEF